ncbi:hypothetical protein ACFSUJ_08200 [Streptomyces lusitanus]|uniref:Lipoprotein n=1 Tax=Streptomyces lusitanus TaxID=68232 RepID=A0ABU3JUN8_9ACTN|nr:hypothetical protein [Streptomyces lusitanus]
MGRGGTSRSTGAFRAPLLAVQAATLAVLAAALTLTGCTTHNSRTPSDAAAASSASPASPDSPSPQVTSDADLCVSIVVHWSREVLDGRGYGDYQSMGMSGGQYDILREVVDAGRAALRSGTTTPHSVDVLMERQARERCAARYRDGRPTEGPWR